jgi:hypothetical protein
MEDRAPASTRPTVLQPCPYRAARAARGAKPGEAHSDLTCKAMGGKRLGRTGEDEDRIADICNRCTIPREAAFRPCLFLVPIKATRNGALEDYFVCRWFYRLQPERPHQKTRYMCGGCPYWFPMPPVDLIRDLERVAHRMIEYHTRIWESPPAATAAVWRDVAPSPKPVWRRALDSLARWWGW